MRRHTTLTSGLITLCIGALATVFVATHRPELDKATAPIVAIADGTVAQVAGAAATADTSHYLGFDTYRYPGDAVMRAWREEDVPYDWVGYYLPAPCHKETSWSGTRQRLTDMGWGLAVVYVGQQTWNRTPRDSETITRVDKQTVMVAKRVRETVRRNGRRVTQTVVKRVPQTRLARTRVRVAVDPAERPIDECNANLIGAARGRIEADDAIAHAAAEEFPRGSVIFLDLERMDPIPPAMREYYRAWTARVLEDGSYVPGFYAHKANAAVIYGDVTASYAAAGMTREPPFWIAGGREFDTASEPRDVGHAFAAMWQGILDVAQEWKGFKLPIDVNVSYLSNPSAPASPGQ